MSNDENRISDLIDGGLIQEKLKLEPVIPYIENTTSVRTILNNLGYSPLNFYQGKKYVRPIIGVSVSAKENWKSYSYLTFSEEDLNYWNLLDCRNNVELFIKKLEVPKFINPTPPLQGVIEQIEKLKLDKSELVEALKYASRMLKNSKDAMYDENYIAHIINKME